MAESAPYADELTLGDPASPVGLCTLWTRQERILRGVPRDLYAVCGNLYSLWGISLLVRGVLARPALRYLVLCGVDYADTGRALVALVAHGLAADGTLPGTEARLADDLDAAALHRFRQQVSVVDLRGCTDAVRVAAAIRALPPPPPGAAPEPILVPAGWTPPEAPPPPPSSLRPRETAPPSPPNPGGERVAPAGLPPGLGGGGRPSSPHLAGRGGFQPDPLGNFLIAVGGGQIVAAHATTTGGPTGRRFVGRTAAEVSGAILAAGLVSQLDHAAYLGAELARAELALRLGVPYRQDRPLALPARQG
jgi:tetrahydromethanopterin S-methyltransferase subunit A